MVGPKAAIAAAVLLLTVCQHSTPVSSIHCFNGLYTPTPPCRSGLCSQISMPDTDGQFTGRCEDSANADDSEDPEEANDGRRRKYCNTGNWCNARTMRDSDRLEDDTVSPIMCLTGGSFSTRDKCESDSCFYKRVVLADAVHYVVGCSSHCTDESTCHRCYTGDNCQLFGAYNHNKRLQERKNRGEDSEDEDGDVDGEGRHRHRHSRHRHDEKCRDRHKTERVVARRRSRVGRRRGNGTRDGSAAARETARATATAAAAGLALAAAVVGGSWVG